MYADLLFITELMNDYLILTTVSILTNFKIQQRRLLLGAISGALLSTILTCFFSNNYVFFNFFIGIILCLVMIKIAFRPSSRSVLIRLLIYTYATAFIIGGIVSFLNIRIPIVPSWLIFLISCVILNIGILLTAYINKESLKLCQITIHFPDRNFKCSALIDSGNMLVDKKTNLPVSILDKDCIPTSINRTNTNKITFNSLGCENGTLEIIYVPYICIEYSGEKKLIENAPVGVSPFKLSSSNAYRMIISPDIINKWRFRI